MLDGWIRRRIDPPLDRAGAALARAGVGADAVTLAGLALGLLAAGLIAAGAPGWAALLPLLGGRVADGLDGAIARARGRSDFGGFLDIVCDFAVYGAVPLAFALRDPANAPAAAALLAAFYLNGASFLGFAILAAKRGMEGGPRGQKSLYYTAGLLEGTETIAFFALLCLWPAAFVPAATGFAALCVVTALARIVLAARTFRAHRPPR
jgi:phosphatidylglycerophosphate synthase